MHMDMQPRQEPDVYTNLRQTRLHASRGQTIEGVRLVAAIHRSEAAAWTLTDALLPMRSAHQRAQQASSGTISSTLAVTLLVLRTAATVRLGSHAYTWREAWHHTSHMGATLDATLDAR